MGNNILADAIAGIPHIKAFDLLADNRYSSLDLSSLIPILIDSVPSNMLPYLANQWGVLGYKGWNFATTEAKQRQLLKNSYNLNRKAGTPYSIKQALISYGAISTNATSGVLFIGALYTITTYNAGDDFTNVGAASNASGVSFVATGTTPTTWTNGSVINVAAVTIGEGNQIYYNGVWYYNGVQTYGQGRWAEFTVIVNYGSTPTTQQILDMTNIINAWKPARCRLTALNIIP
jgi:hypothetical protein